MIRKQSESRLPRPARACARRVCAGLVCACLVVALAAAGCRSAPVHQTARVVEPEPVVVETPTPLPAPDHLAHAEQLFGAGDLAAAAAEYEAHLADGDEVEGGDLALFRLATMRLTRNGPLYDPAAGSLLLGRLVEVHPGSPFADSASLILDLRRTNRRLDGENDRLRDQLEELRRIDLGDG